MLRKPEQSTINPRIELETFAYFRGQKVEMERDGWEEKWASGDRRPYC